MEIVQTKWYFFQSPKLHLSHFGIVLFLHPKNAREAEWFCSSIGASTRLYQPTNKEHFVKVVDFAAKFGVNQFYIGITDRDNEGIIENTLKTAIGIIL